MAVLTKMVTLCETLSITVLVDGEGHAATIAASDAFKGEAKKLKNRQDIETSLAKLGKLSELGIDQIAGMKWWKHPMRYRAGLFEVRVNALRHYGGILGEYEDKMLYVLLGSEEKQSGEASPTILDRCEAELAKLQRAFTNQMKKGAKK